MALVPYHGLKVQPVALLSITTNLQALVLVPNLL
jgi:hypothetical protein